MAGPRRFDTSTLMPAPVNSAGLGAAPGAHHAAMHAGARRPAMVVVRDARFARWNLWRSTAPIDVRARAPREPVAGRPASWLVSLGFGDLL